MENKLPAGPSIQAPATTNLGAGLDMSRAPSYSKGSNFLQSVGGAVSSFLGNNGVGLLGSLVSGAGNIIGDYLNYRRQNKLYDKQRSDALEDYNTQRQDYLSDLAAERAYNSPAAQVARLKAAGINPNVAFGSGSPTNTQSDAQNTASFRGSAAPSPTTSNLGSAMIGGASGLVASSLAEVQGRQMSSNIELQKAQAIQALANSSVLRQDSRYKEVLNKYANSFFELDNEQKKASLMQSLEQTKLISLQGAKTDAERQFIAKQTDMLQQELNNFTLKMENLRANTQLSYSQRDYYAQQAITEAERALNLWYDSALKEFDVQVKGEYGVDRAFRDAKFHRVFDPIVEGAGIVLDGAATIYGFGGIVNHLKNKNRKPIGFNK